ncbi:cytochrome P450 2B6-like [Cynoglossus semilaevis]|uniref:cytochrome P450 2B6-like n=1 Tax=Cynoglossus semilaevis TaxID=244447 RepID=UPI000D626909|nr:cytochrome P450 2B6-like [Cynoglossus semilaevis]
MYKGCLCLQLKSRSRRTQWNDNHHHVTMLASLAMLFVAVLLLLFLLQGQRGEKFPPGPRVIPIFGNVLQLNLKSPIKDLERLTKKYGKVYSIFFGSRPLVVVNGLEAFKETLVSKAFDFCGKPQDIMFNYAFQVQAHAPGVVLADYSPIWKEQRRFSLMTLRNFGLGKQSMEQRILAEISHVTKVLEENAGGTMDPHLLFHNAASCIICQVLFGKHFEYEDEFLKFSVELFHVTSKILNGPWGIIYDAVIHESQRVANTVPLSVFHETSKDTELMGYFIPKGTMIIPNLGTALNEDGQWKFPHEFNPENFLNDKGEFFKPDAFLPFSAGPRMCLGEGLARMELFLIMTTLLRKFDFIWPEEDGKPDFTPVYGVTLTPKPYRMKIQLRFKCRRPTNFPPGPAALPLLGNLLNLNLANPLEDFEKLRKTYGDIYSLFLGPKPAVMLCGTKVIKEALVNKGADFSGRPQDLLFNDVTGRKGVILADHGKVWRDHRRFALMTMRNFGLGKNSMEERIHTELQHTIEELEQNNGKILSPQHMFHNISSNIICQVLFGKRYNYGDNFIKEIVRCFTKIGKLANGPWQTCLLCFQTVHDLVSALVNQHKKIRVPGEPKDYVDCYLDELDKVDKGSEFSEDFLKGNLLDLHFAGTDTTSNTLLTGFLQLLANPHVQERCQQEIDTVLCGKGQVTFEDRHDMPYMQAVIHESQRVANTVPLSVFHETSKDTELMGYFIPKGTMIIPNLGTALNEDGQWKFPHEFNPENFLNDKGEFFKPDAFLPFSAGPRMCLGEGLARMELFLIMTTLLRKFDFIWPEEDGKPDFTPVYGVTLTPKPYRMKVQLRATQ